MEKDLKPLIEVLDSAIDRLNKLIPKWCLCDDCGYEGVKAHFDELHLCPKCGSTNYDVLDDKQQTNVADH